ncbi:hypothetical protein WN51_06569 [Melipona quadrifasciata]|uniref:Uncharacterized protein n=1 Tax=Melipona quadrifasciata TaxID=166423 RepID=A0A0M8ZR85_9HYME|nr:hypothetical protein WN51_06569 [Melipona quadrifasciata]
MMKTITKNERLLEKLDECEKQPKQREYMRPDGTYASVVDGVANDRVEMNGKTIKYVVPRPWGLRLLDLLRYGHVKSLEHPPYGYGHYDDISRERRREIYLCPGNDQNQKSHSDLSLSDLSIEENAKIEEHGRLSVLSLQDAERYRKLIIDIAEKYEQPESKNHETKNPPSYEELLLALKSKRKALERP